MQTSPEIKDIATALAKAQGAIEGAKKDSLNPHFKNKYADLAAVWDACREQLSKNALSAIQSVVIAGDGKRVLVTRIMHSSGQWIEDGGVPLILSKDDMQGLGSALTYSRRYGLMAMVGIAPEDDDANAATTGKQVSAPTVEITAPKVSRPIPAGAVRLQKTEQHTTSAGKAYWLLVLSTGEEVIEWKEQQAIFAEQAAQDGTPVMITTSGGQWDGKPVVRTIFRADAVTPKKKQTELAAADVAF